MKKKKSSPQKWAKSTIYVAISFAIIMMITRQDYTEVNNILDRVVEIVKAVKR